MKHETAIQSMFEYPIKGKLEEHNNINVERNRKINNKQNVNYFVTS